MGKKGENDNGDGNKVEEANEEDAIASGDEGKV